MDDEVGNSKGLVMTESILAIVMISALLLLGIVLTVKGSIRSAEDVARDLLAENETESIDSTAALVRQARVQLSDPLAKIGLLSDEERDRFKRWGRLCPLLGAGAAICLKLISIPGKPELLVVAAIVGGASGYLAQGARIRSRAATYANSLEFYLPLVMERLVMAVQSGLDIIAALGAIINLERDEDGKPVKDPDPVTRLFMVVHRLTERGLTFEQALEEVAQSVESSAVKHCFIHLAVAHSEGGELVMPLKELSDSTQLYYQETVEEQIAKLPVKATLPLLCTFAGLILCFITTPIIQLMSLAGNAAKNL